MLPLHNHDTVRIALRYTNIFTKIWVSNPELWVSRGKSSKRELKRRVLRVILRNVTEGLYLI